MAEGLYIKYVQYVDYQKEGRYYSEADRIIYKPHEITNERIENIYILPLGNVPQYEKASFSDYLKTQLDKFYLSDGLLQAEERGAICFSTDITSRLELLQWQDLSEEEQMAFLECSSNNYYKEVQGTIEKVVNIFERKKQLDRGEPVQQSAIQTPAPETATKDTAQTPGTDKQTKKKPSRKPRPGSDSSVQRKTEYFKLPKGEAGIKKLQEILRYLRDSRNPKKRTQEKITQKWIAAKIGFNESCWNKKGTLGDCLRELKQRAEQYPNEEKMADYLFCAKILDELKEIELDPESDINRREVPMGTMGDRDKWE